MLLLMAPRSAPKRAAPSSVRRAASGRPLTPLSPDPPTGTWRMSHPVCVHARRSAWRCEPAVGRSGPDSLSHPPSPRRCVRLRQTEQTEEIRPNGAVYARCTDCADLRQTASDWGRAGCAGAAGGMQGEGEDRLKAGLHAWAPSVAGPGGPRLRPDCNASVTGGRALPPAGFTPAGGYCSVSPKEYPPAGAEARGRSAPRN